MKFTSAIVLVAALLAPANVEANTKLCENDGRLTDQERNGKTQVRIGCIGNAEDFGVPGHLVDKNGDVTDKVDCFGQTFFHDGSQCQDIEVLVQYKIQNAMNDGIMFLKWANFKFGGEFVHPTDSRGRTPASNREDVTIDVTKDIPFFENSAVIYKYMATVNPCDPELSRMAWMQMNLKPVTKNEGFWTNNCGTEDTINFQIFDTAADVGGSGLAQGGGPGTVETSKSPKAPSAPKASKAPSPPKASKAPASKSPTVGKGDGPVNRQRRNNRVRRATSRRTPVRA